MTSLSAVISTGLPLVQHTVCRINGDIQNCANPVARVNFFASKFNARLHALSSINISSPPSGSRRLQGSFVSRAADQSEVEGAKDYSSKDVDDNNAAQNAAEMAKDTVYGVANDRSEHSENSFGDGEGSSRNQSQHFQGRGSVLAAVTDSSNQAAQMQRNIQKAGEFGSGTGDEVLHAPEHSGSTEELEEQETVKEKSNEKVLAGNETYMERDDNNAAQNAEDMERETVTGLATRHEEPEETTSQAEGSKEDFGDEARHFRENVEEQAQGFVNSIKTGASRASETIQAAGKDIISRADHAFGQSFEEDEDDSKVLKLKPEDFEEAYIDIDDGSAKDSILL